MPLSEQVKINFSARKVKHNITIQEDGDQELNEDNDPMLLDSIHDVA